MWRWLGCFCHSNACLKEVASEPGDDGAAGLEPDQGESGDPSGAAAPLDGAGILPADRCLAGAGACCVGCQCSRCLLRRARHAARQLPSVAGLTAAPRFSFLYVKSAQGNIQPADLLQRRRALPTDRPGTHDGQPGVEPRRPGALPGGLPGGHPGAGCFVLA